MACAYTDNAKVKKGRGSTSTQMHPQRGPAPLHMQAFAEPDSLGVIAVDGVSELLERRAALLPLAAQLAGLPEDTLSKLEHPRSNYLVGWSRGKEILANGEPDTNKGSFYANPLVDTRWEASSPDDGAAGVSYPALQHRHPATVPPALVSLTLWQELAVTCVISRLGQQIISAMWCLGPQDYMVASASLPMHA